MSAEGRLRCRVFLINAAVFIPCLVLLIRFAALTPSGVMANGTSFNVSKHEVLSIIPHGSRFFQGLVIGETIVRTVSKTARMRQGMPCDTY